MKAQSAGPPTPPHPSPRHLASTGAGGGGALESSLGEGRGEAGRADTGLRATTSASKGAKPAAGLLLSYQGVVAQQPWSVWLGLQPGAPRGLSLESRNRVLSTHCPCPTGSCTQAAASCMPIMACHGHPRPAILPCGCFPASHSLCACHRQRLPPEPPTRVSALLLSAGLTLARLQGLQSTLSNHNSLVSGKWISLVGKKGGQWEEPLLRAPLLNPSLQCHVPAAGTAGCRTPAGPRRS